MNVREMRSYARTLLRDDTMLAAHFLRWINMAYRELSRMVIIPKLNNGDQVALVQVSGSTNKFYLPYDFAKTISFVDNNGRSLDPIPSEDVRQFGEYNTFGSFVQFFEHNSSNFTPLLKSEDASPATTVGIPNRSSTVTASAAVFTDEHVGEWILPVARNTTTGVGNPEDYAYRIASTAGTVAVPSTACVLERPFRGVVNDTGVVADLVTSYFEIRPNNTPIVRIWGDPGSNTTATINIEYQRLPSKLANDEDVPEEPRLSEAIVHKAIEIGGQAYRAGFVVQTGGKAVLDSLASFQTVKDFDKQLIHNFLTANPQTRGYSQISGRHIGQMDSFSTSGIRY